MSKYKVGIVGAGNMGSGIAQKMAMEGLDVTLVDLYEQGVARGMGIINDTLQEAVERKVISADKKEQTLSRINATTSYEALKDMDLIIEAVFEDKKVKGDLLELLDKLCDPKTILATNTSSFYVKDLAERTGRPDRVIGMHYFYHPAKNRLLEIIPHDGTSAETVKQADLIGRLHGKTNIVVQDAPGFAVNRFFIPFLTSSVRLLEEGISNIPTIEAAAKQAFSIGMGPFELMNITGIPIAVHGSDTLGEELSAFYAPPETLRRQAESGSLWNLEGSVDDTKMNEIMDYLYGVALGVAAKMVDEGVATIEDTDRGAKIGLRWRFGPFELMNRIGLERTLKCVEAISNRYEGFLVAELLKEQAGSGKPFEFQYVDYQVKGDVAYLTVNRPEAMNALNSVVVEQLERAFNKAEDDDSVKGIAICGAGKAFIAGADIKFFVDNIKNGRIDESVAFTEKGHRLLRRFETCKKPTIAVVDGLSLGGGSELAFACQAIVGTDAASFAFPETGIGIYPGLGGMIRSARIFGQDLAKYYVMTGKTIRAKDALALGIITEMTSIDGIEAAVERLVSSPVSDKYKNPAAPEAYTQMAGTMANHGLSKILAGEIPEGVDEGVGKQTISILSVKAPLALKVAEELMDAQAKVSIDEAIALELGRLVEIFSTQDALAGLSTPPGKRVEFTGK